MSRSSLHSTTDPSWTFSCSFVSSSVALLKRNERDRRESDTDEDDDDDDDHHGNVNGLSILVLRLLSLFSVEEEEKIWIDDRS